MDHFLIFFVANVFLAPIVLRDTSGRSCKLGIPGGAGTERGASAPGAAKILSGELPGAD